MIKNIKNTLIGCDFSINKPATCLFHDNKYYFIAWPHGMKEDIKDIFKSNGVTIIDRTDDKEKGSTNSEQMRYVIENSNYLANLIRASLEYFINKNTYLAFEGLSYASTGDMALQLGGYKYVTMNELKNIIPLSNMFTYSPITCKSIAGCAKRGMGKADMIDKFIEIGPNCAFRTALKNNPELFQSKKAKNWIMLVDDLVDAYFVLKTLQIKEKL